MADSRCPACSDDRWEEAFQVGLRGADPSVYERCRRCGLLALSGGGAGGDHDFYDEGYFNDGGARGGYADYEQDAHLHRRNARDRLRRVEQARPGPPGTLVEVGCATGIGLDVAREHGWRTIGVEISPWAAERARTRGHEVVASLDDVHAPDGVDAVCFFQVLEHLPEPHAALASARRVLADDGVVVCETWDAGSRVARWAGRRWQQLSPPSVLWVLDEHSAAHLLEAAGLRLRSWRRTSKVVSLGLVLGQTGRRLPRPLAALARARLRYVGDDLATVTASSGP